MKLQNLFLTLFAATALLVGCKEEEPEPALPVLNVGQTELSFEQAGGTATVTVTSNRPWSISTDADWLAFSPSTGTASDAPVNVTVTALANSSTDRTSSFKVKTDFDYKTVNVSQKGQKGEDPNTTPMGKGTVDDPYNVVAAINAVANLTYTDKDNYQTTDVVYVKGKIFKIEDNGTFTGGGNYGNASFHISTDGSTVNDFYAYRILYLGNKKFKTGQTDIKVGDEVVICGKLMNYSGKTPETVAGDAYLYSLNGETSSGQGTESDPKGTGTLEDPYNPAGAAAAVANLTWTSNDNYQTTDDVYVKGKICKIAENGTFTDGGNYGNASFFISEDGEGDGEFQVYRALYLGNKKFESGQTDIKVGDEVIICGKLMNYRENTPETVAGKAYVYSLNGETGDTPGPSGDPKGTGTIEDPYNPAGAAAAVKDLTWTSNTEYQSTEDVYVKGKICKIADNGTFTAGGAYGNASFFISEDGEGDGEFQVYRVLYLGNKKFESGQTDIKIGDEVIICGKLMNYRGNTPETVAGKAYVYSLNGVTGGDDPGPGDDVTEATVAEAIAAANDALLKVGPALVVASSSTGFLMEQDGAMIYVFKGAAEVGDNVTVKGKKAEYGGAPQLSDNPEVTVNSKGNQVTYPEAKDINSSFDSYTSSAREYVTFKGTLNISGNYCNVAVDGATAVTGSILKPNDDISALNGKKVTVTGYYLYHTSQGKYLNVIATKVEEDGSGSGDDPGPGPDPGVKGTLENPYSPAEAAAAVKDLTWTSNTEYQTTDEVYVKGKICKIANKGTFTEGGTYGNATFFISADGTGDGEFQVYRTLYLGNRKFAEGDTDIKVNDEVIIFGKLMNYKGETPETEANKSYLYSLNGQTSGAGGGSEPGGGDTSEEGTITWASSTSWTGVADGAETISYKSGNITITAKKDKASTKPTVNGSANDCRVYAKGTLTITTTGDAMTSIVFNISKQGQARLTSITANTGTIANQAKGDKTVKWTGSAKSVTFTVGEKAIYGSDGESKAGQFDFSSVVIK